MKLPPGAGDARGGQPNPCSVRESAYDALQETSPKILKGKAEYGDPRYVSNHVACFIIHVFPLVFGDTSCKTWMSWNTPLFFSAQGVS